MVQKVKPPVDYWDQAPIRKSKSSRVFPESAQGFVIPSSGSSVSLPGLTATSRASVDVFNSGLYGSNSAPASLISAPADHSVGVAGIMLPRGVVVDDADPLAPAPGRGEVEFVTSNGLERKREISDGPLFHQLSPLAEKVARSIDASVTTVDYGYYAPEKQPNRAPYVTPFPIHEPLQVLQDVYRELFGAYNLNDHEPEFDADKVETGDLDLAVDGQIQMKEPARFTKLSRIQYMPKLQTFAVPNRANTQRELLLGVNKRNCAVTHTEQPFTDSDIDESLDRMMDQLCVPDWRIRIAEFQTEPVEGSTTFIDLWERDLTRNARVLVERNFAETEDGALDYYGLMLRKKLKARGDAAAADEYLAVQTVVYHDKSINARWSPVFREIQRRGLSLLRPGVFVMTDRDPRELTHLLNACLDRGKHYYPLEQDMSKYDKSQQERVIRTEMRWYLRLGLSRDRRSEWMNGQIERTAFSMEASFYLYLLWQRTSGGATTLLGNTACIMTASTDVVDLSSSPFVVFLGDDVLEFFEQPPDVSRLQGDLENLYNLIGKPLQPQLHAYFCGMYCLSTPDGWYAVGDPIKRIEKLGSYSARDDLFSEWQDAYKLMTEGYQIPEVRAALAIAVAERYHTSLDIGSALDALYALARGSSSDFASLWKPVCE